MAKKKTANVPETPDKPANGNKGATPEGKPGEWTKTPNLEHQQAAELRVVVHPGGTPDNPNPDNIPSLAKACREVLEAIGVDSSNEDVLAEIRKRYPSIEVNERSYAATVSKQRANIREGKPASERGGRKARAAKTEAPPEHITRAEFINVVRAIQEDVEAFQSAYNAVAGVVATAGGWGKLVEAMAKIEDPENLARAIRIVEIEDDSKALGF